MAFLDREGGIVYPHSKQDVYKAVIEAITKIQGMEIKSADEVGGRIQVKSGVSFRTIGENIPITITEIKPGKTRVDIISSPKAGIFLGGALDFGKNRENIEKIFGETSKILSKIPPIIIKQDVSDNDPTTKLIKLKEMFDKQLINKEEYEAKKSEILSNI